FSQAVSPDSYMTINPGVNLRARTSYFFAVVFIFTPNFSIAYMCAAIVRVPRLQPCAWGIAKEESLWIRGPMSITTERVLIEESTLMLSKLNFFGGVTVTVFGVIHFMTTPI